MSESYWNDDSAPYLYPGSSVLRNLPGSLIAEFERRATWLAVDEAMAAICDLPLDVSIWQTIHPVLFQSVFAWVGQLRSVQLATGSTVFAMPAHIECQAGRISRSLAQEDLAAPDRNGLASRLTFYFGELNAIHPFREGNGRTQKLLFDEITRRTGYRIVWKEMESDVLLQDVIAAFHRQDYSLVETLFQSALAKSPGTRKDSKGDSDVNS